MQNDFTWLAKSPTISPLIKKHNWEATSLGPVKDWPKSLKTAINMCLETRYPMYIWWGPDLVNIYNDAYLPIAGLVKHERSFGRPAIEMWPETWDRVQQVVKNVYEKNESVSFQNFVTKVERYGTLEEAYFDYTVSILRDDEGKAQGIFSIVFEKPAPPLLTQDQNPFKIMSDFFNQAPAAMCLLLGEKHTYALASPLYEKIIGKKVIGKTVLELFGHEDIAPYIEILDNVYKTQTPFRGEEMIFKTTDDHGVTSEYCLDVLYQPFLNDQGKSKGILLMIKDVSENKQLKDEIKELRARLL